MDLKAWRLRSGLRAQEARREAQEELKKLTVFQRLLIRLGRIRYLGEETREDWTGFVSFYLFWCPECQKYYVDYRHGFRPYVTCHRCLTHYDLEPWRTFLMEMRDLLRFLNQTWFGRSWEDTATDMKIDDKDIEILD